MIKYILGIVIVTLVVVVSCNKTDDTPPIIFMNGADTLVHILNQTYVDEGATATDETDGNITYNIYTDNPVDENKVGWYTVTYKVVDEAGNEAAPATRSVFVYNQAYDDYTGDFNLTETEIPPGQNSCTYDINIWIDSTVNYRVVFNNFACSFGKPVFADVSGSYLLFPFQTIEDSISSFVIQGSGSINDSIWVFDYVIKNDSIKSWLEAELIPY